MRPRERRTNRGGTQRATRVALVYVITLAALYLGLLLYGRTAPGGIVSFGSEVGLLFAGLFAAFAVVGALLALTPAPRFLDVTADRVVVIGRWGRVHRLPPLPQLSLRVVRRYSENWLSEEPVELIEVWAEGVPVRSYLASADLFSGAVRAPSR